MSVTIRRILDDAADAIHEALPAYMMEKDAEIMRLRKALAVALPWMGSYPENNEGRARFFADVQLVRAVLGEGEP